MRSVPSSDGVYNNIIKQYSKDTEKNRREKTTICYYN